MKRTKEKSCRVVEFPGGKLEINESLEDCILRELKEELNIDAELHSLYDNYSFKAKDVIYDLYFLELKDFQEFYQKPSTMKLNG